MQTGRFFKFDFDDVSRSNGLEKSSYASFCCVCLLQRQIDRSRQQKKQQMQRQRQNGSPASKAPPVASPAPPADGYIPVKRFEGSRLASAPQPAPQSVAGQSNGAQSEGPKSNVDAAKALKEKLLGKKTAEPPPAKLLRVDEEDSSIASAVPTKVDEKVIDEVRLEGFGVLGFPPLWS
jgi:hypothetical protein